MISLSLLSQTADWAIAWSAVCCIMQDFDLVSMAKEGPDIVKKAKTSLNPLTLVLPLVSTMVLR